MRILSLTIKPCTTLNIYVTMLRNHDTANELKTLGSRHSATIPETPYNIPSGYFENLPHQVLQRIHSEAVQNELKAISPMLAAADKTNVYRVPDHYFEQRHPFQVTKSTSSVLRFSSKRKTLQYAMAAAIFTAIGFITFFLTNSGNKIPGHVIAGLNIKTEAAFNHELAMLSEAEIYSYLITTVDLTDIETIASWVDPNALPAETDYMDARFMENYFQQIDKTTKQNNL